MAEIPQDLQKQLHIFHDYCLAWKLKVNIDKTKIVCFTTFMIFSIACEIVRRPVALWFSKKSSRSFKKLQIRKGTSFHLV
jgi:hypothetical protein